MASRRPPVDEDPLLSGGGAPQRVDFIFTMDMDEGYGSMDEDEDPLHQQLPPEDFQQAWRPVIPPVPVAAPQQPTAGHPQEGSPEDAAPSTSDLRPMLVFDFVQRDSSCVSGAPESGCQPANHPRKLQDHSRPLTLNTIST